MIMALASEGGCEYFTAVLLFAYILLRLSWSCAALCSAVIFALSNHVFRFPDLVGTGYLFLHT